MQDNFTGDNTEMLIRYMDGELNAEERIAVENLLQNDESAQEHYRFFLAAKSAVRSEGIKQRVAGIQRQFLQERESSDNISIVKKKGSSVFKSFMSVAAVLAFLVIGYGGFQYFTTTNQKVYNDAYISYQLPVNRGEQKTNEIDSFYNTGNYQSAISSFTANPDRSQKDYFVAGLSYLRLDDVNKAVATFQQLEALNAAGLKKMYVQETDYYLMLAYLKAGDIDKAEKKLDKIRSDKNHLFYQKAGNISRLKLAILKWKEK